MWTLKPAFRHEDNTLYRVEWLRSRRLCVEAGAEQDLADHGGNGPDGTAMDKRQTKEDACIADIKDVERDGRPRIALNGVKRSISVVVG